MLGESRNSHQLLVKMIIRWLESGEYDWVRQNYDFSIQLIFFGGEGL